MSTITHAKVKFDQDKAVRIVSIDKILEFKDVKPVHINDFDKNALYTCLWTDDKNPEEIELAVQISNLAAIECQEELKSFKSKRGNFPAINATVVEEFYNELDDDDDDAPVPKKSKMKTSVNEKNAIAEKKRVQAEILNAKMEKFVNSSPLVNVPSNSKLIVANKNANQLLEMPADTLHERYHELSEAHNNLLKKYSNLEKENENLKFLNTNLQMKFLCSRKEKNSEAQLTSSTDESQSKQKDPDAVNLQISPIPFEEINVNTCGDPQTCSTPTSSQGLTRSNTIPQDASSVDPIDVEMASGYNSNLLFTPPKRPRVTLSSESNEEPDGHIAKKLNFHTESQGYNKEKIVQNTNEISKQNKQTKENKNIKNNTKDIPNTKNVKKDKENKMNDTKEKSTKSDTENRKASDGHGSDNPIGPEFLGKVEIVENGVKVWKVYLEEGIYIDAEAWNDYLDLPTANRFTVAMLKELYTPEQLSKRSVSGHSTWKTPNGVHTRKKLTPRKNKIIEKCTKYYLKKKFKLSKKQLKKELSFKNKYITGHISKIVNSMKAKSEKEKSESSDSDDNTSLHNKSRQGDSEISDD